MISPRKKEQKVGDVREDKRLGKIQMRFSKEQQHSFSETHYRNSFLLVPAKYLPTFGPFAKYAALKHSAKLSKVQKSISQFEETVKQKSEDCSEEEFKSCELQFCKVMYNIQNICKEEGDDVPTQEIRELVYLFLHFLFRCRSTAYPWDEEIAQIKEKSKSILLELVAGRFSDSPRVKRKRKRNSRMPSTLSDLTTEMVKSRDTIVNQIVQTFREIIGWHRKSFSFVVRPVEQEILAPHYYQTISLYRKDVRTCEF